MLKQVENDSQTGEKDWSNLLNKGALTIHNKEVKEWTTYLNIQVEALFNFHDYMNLQVSNRLIRTHKTYKYSLSFALILRFLHLCLRPINEIKVLRGTGECCIEPVDIVGS